MSNAYFLANFRFDTAENEPAKNLQNFRKMHFSKMHFRKMHFRKMQPAAALLRHRPVADAARLVGLNPGADTVRLERVTWRPWPAAKSGLTEYQQQQM